MLPFRLIGPLVVSKRTVLVAEIALLVLMPPESRAWSVPPAKTMPLDRAGAVDSRRVGRQRAAVERNRPREAVRARERQVAGAVERQPAGGAGHVAAQRDRPIGRVDEYRARGRKRLAGVDAGGTEGLERAAAEDDAAGRAGAVDPRRVGRERAAVDGNRSRETVRARKRQGTSAGERQPAGGTGDVSAHGDRAVARVQEDRARSGDRLRGVDAGGIEGLERAAGEDDAVGRA